nr:VCBS repeat-containing protein [Micromonospora polyrhachis]
MAGDFTGDGIDDVAAIVDDQAGGWTAHVYPSTGRFFSTPAAPWHVQGSGTYTWASSHLLAGDFTGDGKADLAVVQEGTGGQSSIRVHASTGSGFTAGSQWWDSGTDADPAGFAGNSARYVVGNVTGSGADDVVALYHDGTKSSVKVLTTVGSTFASPVTWWDSDTGSATGWNWADTTQLTLGDFDNDADLDLAAIVGTGQPGQAELWRFPNAGTSFGQVIKQGTIGTP